MIQPWMKDERIIGWGSISGVRGNRLHAVASAEPFAITGWCGASLGHLWGLEDSELFKDDVPYPSKPCPACRKTLRNRPNQGEERLPQDSPKT